MNPSRKLNSWPEARMTETSSDRLGAGDTAASSSQVETALVSEQLEAEVEQRVSGIYRSDFGLGFPKEHIISGFL